MSLFDKSLRIYIRRSFLFVYSHCSLLLIGVETSYPAVLIDDYDKINFNISKYYDNLP